MKKLLYVALFAIGTSQAQNITFDGDIFKNKLLQSSTSNSIAKDVNGQNYKIDNNGDGFIDQQEALSVYKLEVQSSSIINSS